MIKALIFFLITALIIIQSKLDAQSSFAELDNNKITYPSPTAAALGKYGEYPVNLYNGLVNIGQDIVTVKSGRLSLNISLSYHASGNKPSDIPGWVGLGFSLNAGGVITRIIRDLPDDVSGGFYNSNESVKLQWNNTTDLLPFVENYYSGVIDPRSDEYQFNFCGKTGEFVFDWDRQIHFKQKVPFEIREEYGPGGFAGFIITTDDGTVYTFDQQEGQLVKPGGAPGINPASSWYLTKIKNLSGDSIILKYTVPMNKYRYKQYSTTKEIAGTISLGQLQAGETTNLNTTADQVIYLDTIIFNNGKLLFETSQRQDPVYVPAGVTANNVKEDKLDLIILKGNNNNIIKQWKFEYFENNTERLKLKNLIVQDNDQSDIQKYSFDYDIVKLPLPLPGPNPNVNPYLSNSVDYWGYYNGAVNSEDRIPKIYISTNNTTYGSADRSISSSLVKAEVLEKITYSTGGYTSFEYESNDYSDQGESFAEDQNPMFITPPPESYSFLYDRDNGGFDVDPSTISFTLTETTHVNEQYSCGSAGPLHSWANPGTMYNYDIQLAAGTYTLQSLLNTNELLSPNSSDITKATATIIVYNTSSVTPLNAKTGPGLRIKSIKNYDGINTTVRTFEYTLENSPKSSGVLSVFPAFYAPLQAFGSYLQGVYVTSEPINDVGDGFPVGYRRVVERFQDNSSIVHNYTSYLNYPDEMMPFLNGSAGYLNPQLAHMTSNDFWRGLETSTNYYNSTGIIQKSIINTYDTLPGSLTDVQDIDLKPTVSYNEGTGTESEGQLWSEAFCTLFSLYNTHSCFLYNSSTTETIFDKNGQNPITNTVKKYYDNLIHLQPTRMLTSSSDGSMLTTTTSYPNDFASGIPFIDYMQINHLTSFPVEQVTYRQRGSVNNIVSGNIITYKTFGAGIPDQLLQIQSANPVVLANFKFSNRSTGILPPSSSPSQYNADIHYKSVLTYTLYDNKGNLLESISYNGIKTCYLWGYNSQYPIAKIVGSDFNTAKAHADTSVLNNGTEAQIESQLVTLRRYFSSNDNVQVTTYTYSPLIGMTSETDPKGNTIFYEYDGFGRLKDAKDKDGNVVKRYDYHYQEQ